MRQIDNNGPASPVYFGFESERGKICCIVQYFRCTIIIENDHVIVDDAFSSDAPHQFLMALNGHYMFIRVFVEQERVPAPPPLLFSIRPKDQAFHEEVTKAYVDRMRQLADAWIETGRTNGVEEPRKRKLTSELWRTLNEWAARNQPDLCFTHSGEREVLLPACKIDYGAPLDAALNDAVRFFGRFLDSPYRTRLFKCQWCNEYYFTQRQPVDRVEFGTYCPKHRQRASAKRSNASRRDPEHQTKLRLAVDAWGSAPEALSDAAKLVWVADEINKGLRDGKLLHYYAPIKRNFVKRHLDEIKAEAQGRAHAQS